MIVQYFKSYSNTPSDTPVLRAIFPYSRANFGPCFNSLKPIRTYSTKLHHPKNLKRSLRIRSLLIPPWLEAFFHLCWYFHTLNSYTNLFYRTNHKLQKIYSTKGLVLVIPRFLFAFAFWTSLCVSRSKMITNYIEIVVEFRGVRIIFS